MIDTVIGNTYWIASTTHMPIEAVAIGKGDYKTTCFKINGDDTYILPDMVFEDEESAVAASIVHVTSMLRTSRDFLKNKEAEIAKAKRVLENADQKLADTNRVIQNLESLLSRLREPQ